MYTKGVSYEWDHDKSAAIVQKQGIQFSSDFSGGKRGRFVAEPPMEPGEVRITIRLDEDLVDYFGASADRSGGKTGSQTLINSALREYVEGKTSKREETLRRAIREEISRNNAA